MAVDREAILQRAYDNMAKIDETLAELAEPRPVMTYEPPQPTRYRGYEVETMHDMLKASEARIDKRLDVIEARQSVRLDALEGRVQKMWGEMSGLADEAGGAVGELEKKLRDELKKEADSLRGEITMLRSAARTSPERRQKQPVSRAPFKLDEDNAFRN